MQGARKLLVSNPNDHWSDGKAAWIAAICAGGCAIITGAVVVPLLRRKVDRVFDQCVPPDPLSLRADASALLGRFLIESDLLRLVDWSSISCASRRKEGCQQPVATLLVLEGPPASLAKASRPKRPSWLLRRSFMLIHLK